MYPYSSSIYLLFDMYPTQLPSQILKYLRLMVPHTMFWASPSPKCKLLKFEA